MRIHDELRNELSDSAARIDPGPPPTRAIVRRARRRHAVRRVSIVVASIGIAALAIVPLLSLAGLLGNRADPLPVVSPPGQGSSSETRSPVMDPTQNVLRQTVCEVPGGTIAAFELRADLSADQSWAAANTFGERATFVRLSRSREQGRVPSRRRMCPLSSPASALERWRSWPRRALLPRPARRSGCRCPRMPGARPRLGG